MKRTICLLLALAIATPVFAHPCPDCPPTKTTTHTTSHHRSNQTLAMRQRPIQPAQTRTTPSDPNHGQRTEYRDCGTPIWPFLLGAAIIVGAVIIANGDDDDDNARCVTCPPPPPVKEPCK